MLLQFHNQPVSIHQPKRLFISYSHKDREYVDLFIEALFPLKREGLVSEWQDHMIRPGDPWQETIAKQIENSDMILFWISPSFLASKYCLEVEVKQALSLEKQGKVKVVPILVRPVPLEGNELFNMQALPPRGRPLALYSERATGVREVVEAIRLLVLDARFEDDSGTGGVWMMRVASRLDGADGILAEDIRSKLVDLTKDTSIRLVAQGSVRGDRGKAPSDEAVLILRGSAEAYTMIHQAHAHNTLSEAVGIRVVDFSQSVGSTLQTSSVIYPVDTMKPTPVDESYEEILYPSEPRELPKIHGVKVLESNLLHFDFIFDTGNINRAKSGNETQKCIDHFLSSLLLSEDNLWVNLSAYESNRMIPAVLGGTEMGREMLDFDCVLKQFTASLLHPDTLSGKRFWNVFFQRLQDAGCNAEQPVQAYNKVWIVPEKLLIYHKAAGDPVPENLQSWKVGPFRDEEVIAIICESRLKVKSEWDLMAYTSNGIIKPGRADEIYMQTFDEIIVPLIDTEVNTGGMFAAFRQIYNSLGLAAFIRKYYAGNPQLKDYLGSNKPGALRATILAADGQAVPPNPSPSPTTSGQWEVAENRLYHDRYMRLFKEGLYRVVRTFAIDGRPSCRVFFSGALDFRAISDVLA